MTLSQMNRTSLKEQRTKEGRLVKEGKLCLTAFNLWLQPNILLSMIHGFPISINACNAHSVKANFWMKNLLCCLSLKLCVNTSKSDNAYLYMPFGQTKYERLLSNYLEYMIQSKVLFRPFQSIIWIGLICYIYITVLQVLTHYWSHTY